jgi:hypothetical protein
LSAVKALLQTQNRKKSILVVQYWLKNDLFWWGCKKLILHHKQESGQDQRSENFSNRITDVISLMRHPIEGFCPSTRYNSQLRVITASVEYFTFINATDTWQFVFDVDCFVMAPLVLIYQIRIKKLDSVNLLRSKKRRRWFESIQEEDSIFARSVCVFMLRERKLEHPSKVIRWIGIFAEEIQLSPRIPT